MAIWAGSREWQRIDKIKLGYMVQKNGKEYPTSSDKFEVSDELKHKLLQAGFIKTVKDEIRELDIMFPSDDVAKVAPCHLKRYNGKNQLICKGDGQNATITKEHIDYVFKNKKTEYGLKVNNGQYFHADGQPVKTKLVGGKDGLVIKCNYKKCPYYNKNLCKEVATINVVLYKLPELGVYSIETSSYNSYQNVINSINMIKNCVGHLSFIPLKLRVKMEAKGDFKKKFPILYLDMDMTIEQLINKYRGQKPGFEPDFQPEDDDNKPQLLFGPFADSVTQNQRKPNNNSTPNQKTTNPSGNEAAPNNNPQSNPQNQGKPNQNKPTESNPKSQQKKDIGFFEVVSAKKGFTKETQRPFLHFALKQIGGGERAGQVINAFANCDADVDSLVGKRIVPQLVVENNKQGAEVYIVTNWTVVA